MTKYLEIACNQLGIDEDSVIKHRKEGDVYVIIADLGIAGCPKYKIPLSQLVEPEPEPIPEPAPLEIILEDAPDLNKLSYNDLRNKARDAGINTKGMKKADLIAALGG